MACSFSPYRKVRRQMDMESEGELVRFFISYESTSQDFLPGIIGQTAYHWSPDAIGGRGMNGYVGRQKFRRADRLFMGSVLR